tara:strand:- start:5072 stop:5386 length:315 start_codon:yes stop_codon:yes gene_type:complete
MKKGKITETERACIRGMMSTDLSQEEMAKQLDRSVESVKKEVEKLTQEAIRDQLILKKTGKGESGVAVMTEAASLKADADRQSFEPPEKSQAERGKWVHTIYGK